ncbi:MAG: PDGLE domain-containing protein [Coriobacteriia bacterium]|nr:PDGLE domain-containing protein [Coriobacteriia bacterium]
MLSTPVALLTDVGAVGLITYATAWVKKHLSEQKIVLMAVLGALIFALQMLNFPVAGGTSGHFLGAALAAIVVGFWPAVIVMAAVLGIQALVFSDGGILAYGANLLNMGIIAALVGWGIYRLVCWIAARRRGEESVPRSARIGGAALGAWAGTMAAALACSLEIIISGNAKPALILPAMLGVHMIIGIGEAVITGGIVGYLALVRPDLLSRGDKGSGTLSSDDKVPDPLSRSRSLRPVVIVLAALAIGAAGFSWAASKYPDGLEHVYFSQQIGNTAAVENAPSLLGKGTVFAGYEVRGLTGSVPTVIAGLIGVALVAALLALVLLPFRRKAHVSAHGKLVAGFALILFVVLLPGFNLVAFLLLLLVLSFVARLLGAPLRKVWRSAALVLLFAGVIAVFSPLSLATNLTAHGIAQAYVLGWPRIAEIMSKAFLSAFIVSTVNRSSTPSQVIEGLADLRLPAVMLMLVSFIYRFSAVFREELRQMQQALASRAPTLRGWARVRLYGSLGGNLFVRAYERGEEVHRAMVSRGYTGRLPDGGSQRWSIRETTLVVGALAVGIILVASRLVI